MKRTLLSGLAVLIVLASSLLALRAQEEPCRLLDPESGRRFLPDRVPMEAELIQVDGKNYSALQFANKNRIAIAALVTAGYAKEIQQRYQYVLISETRIRLDRWSIPAGMVGLSMEPETQKDAPTRILIARDFSGTEIDRITLQLDPNASGSSVSFTPKGSKEFELRIGRYLVQGSQR